MIKEIIANVEEIINKIETNQPIDIVCVLNSLKTLEADLKTVIADYDGKDYL